MQNSVAKKIFAVGSAVAMTLAIGAPLVAFAAPDANGTNISDSSGTVYTIINGQRDPYTSAGAFLSYGFNSWSQVVPASSSDLALPVGSFIPPQDGSIICSDRGADQGTCYEVSGGMKYGFTSAAVFTGLGFSFSNALSGDVSWMSAGSSLISNVTMAHLPGTLVNNGGTVQLVGGTGLLGVPDLATFNSWGYSFAKVVPANAADKSLPQTGVFAARTPGQLSPSWTTSPTCTSNCGSPVVSGSVSASLSSDTPAAGTLVANSNGTSPGQTGADLAHFTFSGTGTVTQVVVNRIGVSADQSLSNVYLYQGNNRITSAGSFSNGMVTFSNSNGLFTVSGSAEISVKVDVAANASSGQTVGAQLSSFTVANGSPMTSSISGNLFQIASVNNLATAQLSVASGNSTIISSGATGGTAGTINAGTTNAILWQTPVSIGQRTVLLKHIAFTQIGSVQSNAITNLQFFVDGTAVGTAGSVTTVGGQNQVVFDFSGSPVSLSTGSHTLSLEGNIIGGTSFTFEYSLQTAADAVFYDTNYNVNVPLTYNAGATIFQLAPGLTTINSGTLSVQSDPAFTATQFVTNSSQVLLGQWDLTAYGENVNVNQLKVQLTYTGTMTSNIDGFNNLSVYVNGGSVGSSQSALAGANGCGTGLNISCTFSFGTTNLFTVQAGQTVTVQVKGDSVVNASDISAVQAALVVPANTIQGQTSYSLSPATQQTYSANSLTTGSSFASLAKNTGYTNQTVGSNQNNIEIGSYTIQASSIDGVRVNQLTVGLSGTLNSGSPTTGLTSLYLAVAYPGGSATTTPVNPSASNTFTLNNVTIPANQTATVNVMANVSNSTGNVATTLAGSGQGLTSNQSVPLNSVPGQTITVGNGSINNPPTKQTSSPVASFVIGGTQSQPAATFNFVASSGGAVIQELDFMIATSGGATTIPVTSVTVGGVTSPVVGSTSTVTGLNISVPTSFGGIDVPVTVNYATVGNNGIPSNQIFTVNLTKVKYLSGSSTQTMLPNVASNSFDLVASAPTVSLGSVSSRLTAGTVIIGQVTVSANASGNIILDNLPISFSANNASITASTIIAVDASTGVTAGTSTNPAVNSNGSATTTIVFTGLAVDNNIAAGTSKTYNIEATVGAVGNSTNGNPSVSLGLGSAALFTFKDVNGNIDNIPGAVAGNTYLSNYPTTQVSIAP